MLLFLDDLMFLCLSANKYDLKVTKQFFPNVRDRIHRRITINPNFTALVTGHGKTKSYLYRFKITQHAPATRRIKLWTTYSTTAHAIKNKETYLSRKF